MKAALYDRYGGPEILRIGEVPKPDPGAGELLVEVKAASVNPVDWKIRRGNLKLLTGFRFPKRIGMDFSGIVRNSSNSKFKNGDAVYGKLGKAGIGAIAEWVTVKPEHLSLKPGNLSFEEAAAVPLAGLTALQVLKYKGRLKHGMQVLINGCAGGVGHLAVQYAKAYGAVVTGICSTSKIDTAYKIGADHLIDYKSGNVYEKMQNYDIIFDAVGNMHYFKIKQFLTQKGTLIAFTPNAGDLTAFLLRPILKKKVSLFLTSSSGEDLNELKNLIEQNKIHPLLHRVFNFTEVSEAYRESEKGHATGKIVIRT
jgi:NADPH:quinone reductase-like Zn-dependent oxidoreductase